MPLQLLDRLQTQKSPRYARSDLYRPRSEYFLLLPFTIPSSKMLFRDYALPDTLPPCVRGGWSLRWLWGSLAIRRPPKPAHVRRRERAAWPLCVTRRGRAVKRATWRPMSAAAAPVVTRIDPGDARSAERLPIPARSRARIPGMPWSAARPAARAGGKRGRTIAFAGVAAASMTTRFAGPTVHERAARARPHVATESSR